MEDKVGVNEMRRGRFAPTPSGPLHIGNARTALLAWLQMRKAGGTIVLRIEDIDQPRSKPEYAAQLLEDMRWLGLDWDEGPDIGGPYAPYEQSRRLRLYEEALHQLERNGWLYPCYCSRAQRMKIASAPHGLSGEGPAYPGLCRRLSEQERAERAAHKRPAYRFALPDRSFHFDDLYLGPQSFPAGAGGDFIVRRADDIFAYQLAVVVDDAAMNISDVLRGIDLLDSTPRQLALFDALGLQAPRYTHVPLIHGPDGKRLAKRHGAININDMRRAGVPPQRITGILAWMSGLIERPEPVRCEELIDEFDLDKIPKQPVVLNDTIMRMLHGE